MNGLEYFFFSTGSDDGWVKFWASDTGELKGQLEAHHKAFDDKKNAKRPPSAVMDLAYHPSNLRFATCSDDMTVKYWMRAFSGDSLVKIDLGLGVNPAEPLEISGTKALHLSD
jgi:WD40 repeat protein